MSSSPGSGGGSSPTVWTSATNKSRSGSRTAGWRRRDSCWGSKLWPTFRDAAEGESIGSKSQAFYAPLGLLSMHALIYPSFTLQAIITAFSDLFFFFSQRCGLHKPKNKATIWHSKLFYVSEKTFGIIAQKAVRMCFLCGMHLLVFLIYQEISLRPKCKPGEICRQGNSSVWDDT